MDTRERQLTGVNDTTRNTLSKGDAMNDQSTRNSRKGKATDKPPKPYKDFPLFPHDSGRWAKKIRGRLHYFGRWGRKQGDRIVHVEDVAASAQDAVDLYNEQRDDLYAGRVPRPKEDQCFTLRQLCNEFLTAKMNLVESGELSRHTHADYERACGQMINHFGRSRRVDDLRPDDFETFRKKLAGQMSVVTLGNVINRCRIILKWASDQKKIATPVHFGQSFDKPAAKVLRRARNTAGKRMFEAHELRLLLTALEGKQRQNEPDRDVNADPVMRAMVLLGVNGGLGNTDIANLPQSAIDFNNGWLDYPRPKTEIRRRIPLWPETLAALRLAIESRPEPKDPEDAGLVFVTVQGNRYVRMSPTQKDPNKFAFVNTVATRFAPVLKRLKINGRNRLGFYTLRHNFETVAGGSKDQVAVDAIMGHVDNSMAARYREEIGDDRLRAVVDHVRVWLFGTGQEHAAQVVDEEDEE
jgi:integrase